MSVTPLKASNVTKYDAGGSGDNIISDGFIKTVEKVWIDSYTVSSALTTAAGPVVIGKLLKGKKLTDVVVHLPVITSGHTTGSVYLGTCLDGATTVATGTTHALGALIADNGLPAAPSLASVTTFRLSNVSALTEMTVDSNLYIFIVPGAGGTTITGGTIKSIVRYT